MNKTTRNYIFSITIILLISASLAYSQTWSKTYGGRGWDFPLSGVASKDGGYVFAGWSYSFGDCDGCVWVMKIDKLGNIVWQKGIGGRYRNTAYTIAATPDNAYVVAGWSDSFVEIGIDAYIIKIDDNGKVLWQKRFYDRYLGYDIFEVHSIIATPDNKYVAAGFSPAFGGAAWLSMLDSNGNIIWQKSYSKGRGGSFTSIALTDDGGFIAFGEIFEYDGENTGHCLMKLNKDGNIVWQKVFNDGGGYRKLIVPTSDGGYIATGIIYDLNSSYPDAWIVKLDKNGNILWQKSYGTAAVEGLNGIIQTSDNGYLVTGYTTAILKKTANIWLMKLNESGNIIWQKIIAEKNAADPNFILHSSDGGYLLSGNTDSFHLDNFDAWIFKLDSNGIIDASCGYIKDSTLLKSKDTHAEVIDIDVVPKNATSVAISTDGKVYDANADVKEICPPIQIRCDPSTLPFLVRVSRCSIKSLNDFSGPLRLSCFGLPDGANCNFSSSSIDLGANEEKIFKVGIKIDRRLPAGVYPFSIVATTGNSAQTFLMKLTIR